MANKLHIRLLADYALPTQDEYGKTMSNHTGKVSQVVWKNDKIDLALAILTEDEMMENVSIKTSDFVGENGVVPADKATCTFIKETKAFMGNGKKDNGSREQFPDIFYSSEPEGIPASRLKCGWVTVEIGSDVPAGNYIGKITVSASDGTESSEEFSFRVLDLVAPDPENYEFDMELWQYPYRLAQYYGLEAFGDEHIDVLKRQLLKYKAMGGHAITASIVEEPWNAQTYGQFPSMIKWTKKADKKFHFSFNDFDKWVALAKEVGIGDKIVCYSMIPWGNKIQYYDEKKRRMRSVSPKPGTGKYVKIWKQFLEALVAHTEEKGWFDDIYIGIDERKNMSKSFDLIESVRGTNGKCFKKSVAIDHFSAKFFPIIDRVESISVGSEPAKKALGDYKTLIERRRSNPNLKTTIYTCVGHFPNSFTYSMPMEGYWTMMFCNSQGTTGYLRWALDAWVKDPLRDTTHVSFESGDCFLLYPDEMDSKERESKMSVRLEMLLKGLRDVNKLRVVAGSSVDYKKRVDDLLQTVRVEYSQQHDGIADPKSRMELPQDMIQFIDKMNEIFKDFEAGK